MQSPLKDAISNKRRQSIDVTIILSPDGPPEIVQKEEGMHEMPDGEMMADSEMKEQEKGSDLAPPREESMASSQEEAKEEMAAKNGESDEGLLDGFMEEGQQGYEGKPRSLFERAKMERRQSKPVA